MSLDDSARERASRWRAPPTRERIKHELDLSTLVDQYTDLEDQGGYFTGRCPLHAAPKRVLDHSFEVKYVKEHGWWCGCWTCGGPNPSAGFGDAVDFLRSAERLSEAEAIARARGLLAAAKS